MARHLFRCLLAPAAACIAILGVATAATAATPPTARFTYSPTAPIVGQPVTFDGTSSSCPDAPCTYSWSDDGSPTRPPAPLWPLGSGATLQFTFHEAATKYVRLVVTDASGQIATVEHDVAVASEAPPPPTARFTYSPTAPVVGEPVTFDATSSDCPMAPCTFSWSDDGSSTRPPAPLWPLGSGATLQFTFHEAATKYVRLVITDAVGQTATVEHDVAVAAEAPPVESAPVNSSAPLVSGSPVEGQILSAMTGAWTGSPISYGYQWQDCSASGTSCTDIAGATAASYALRGSDVGHAIRVVVRATNAGGSSSAASRPTAVVAALPVEEKPPAEEEPAKEKPAGEEPAGEEPAKEEPAGEEPAGCSVVVSSVSQINGALKAGAVVCLAAGTYGQVSITTTPASNATLTAAPGAHVVVGGVNIAASNITVSQLHSTGTINVGSGSPYPGFSHDVIEHNDVGPTNGYGISVMSATSTPSSYITIKGNRIHDTSTTSEGDALRFDGWNNITVAENDIYNIKECASDTCHTDTLQSYNGGVATSGLTITRNYTHDNVGAQGLPFLKDGDISNVTISDNLSLHNTNTNGQVTGIWVDENINNLTITNNTYQETSGSIVQADGSAKNPTVNINHNVFDNLNVRPGSGPSYTVTEDYDIYTQNDEYTFNLGPHSTINTKPLYQEPTTNNYQLTNNPNNIGINWNPTQQQYGPTN